LTDLIKSGVIQIVGTDEQVDQNKYGVDVEAALYGPNSAGELYQITLYSSETGSGSVQTPECVLYIFDEDPTVAANDASLTAADGLKAIASVKFESSDWRGDSTVKIASRTVAIPFQVVGSLWFVLQNLSATGINDAGGDDEKIEMQFWWKPHRA
jgi:hypothetical protein